MHKKLLFLVFVMLGINYAVAETFAQNTPNACNFIANSVYFIAEYEPIEYTCNAGYYLPANHEGCVQCPSIYTCAGGTFSFNKKVSQGIIYSDGVINQNISNMCAVNLPRRLAASFEPNAHTCGAGYYLPAGVDACTLCTVNNICAGGTYSFNETISQGIQSCASGTFAPTGSTVCYPHILHVGNDNIYLKSTKQTTPSLNIRIGNDIFYANMTTTRTRMNKDSTHYFHAKTADNVHYYICDDTTCPQ